MAAVTGTSAFGPAGGPLAALGARLESLRVPCVPGYGRDASLIIWAWLLWGFGIGLWSYLWPGYLSSLGASSVEVGFVASVNFIVATLCYLPGGFVAQLGHHKWQLAIAHLLPVVSVATFGLAEVWWHVLPGMVVMSLVALVVPAINSFIAQVADDESIPAPRVFTIIGAALYAAMVVTPPIGGWIGDRFGMAAVFPLVSLCYALSVVCMAMIRSRPMPGEEGSAGDGHQDSGSNEDSRGSVDSASQARGTGDSVNAISPARLGGRSPAGAGRLAALRAGGGAYRELLRSGTVRLFLATAFLTHSGMHVALSFAPLYLGDVYGWDRAQIGWVGSAASLGTVILLLTMERFRRRYGAVTAMWFASGCMAAHFGCTVLSPIAAVQAIGFLCRGGFQTVATQTTVAMTEAVSRARLAPATALLATVAGGAAMMAPPAGGWLYARAPESPFLVGMAVMVLSAPLVRLAFRSPPRSPRRVTPSDRPLPDEIETLEVPKTVARPGEPGSPEGSGASGMARPEGSAASPPPASAESAKPSGPDSPPGDARGR